MPSLVVRVVPLRLFAMPAWPYKQVGDTIRGALFLILIVLLISWLLGVFYPHPGGIRRGWLNRDDQEASVDAEPPGSSSSAVA